MKIHEYQARQLLADAGIPVPAGAMVQTVDEAAVKADLIAWALGRATLSCFPQAS